MCREKFGSITHCISIGPSENSVCCVPKARDDHHFAEVLVDDHVDYNEEDTDVAVGQ